MSIANIEAKLRKNNEDENKISRQEVEKHNTKDSSWIIINGRVYDITKFARLHPGGEDIIREFAGKDATQMFYDLHRQETLDKYKGRLYLGDLKDEVPEDIMSANDARISKVPYAESAKWRDGWFSPYYNDTHVEYRKKLRKWFSENVREEAVAFNNMDKPPSLELNQKVAKTGLYAARLGPGPWMNNVNVFGVDGKDFDVFHELITHEEWTRIAGALSVQDGLGTGLVIGLPPVLLFGQEEVKQRVAKECFDGDKRICLAISEPFAGSDVANIRCTATKTEDGKHYIVNGIKKWITNGVFCDYFVTAVRTGGPGIGGISLLLVERSEGLTTKNIKTSYGSSAGTAYVIYENVKVPVENLLGMENGGFQCIMANFNHERWFIVCAISAGCRSIVEECFKWAMQRRVFGKKLISQPVVRQKLGIMIYKVETVHAWLEEITYQMKKMPYEEQFFKLGGPIALLKTAATRMAYDISDNACQIFGGRAITKSNQGKYIEEFQRSIKYGAILGGAEEVMVDLGVRLAQRNFPPQAKL